MIYIKLLTKYLKIEYLIIFPSSLSGGAVELGAKTFRSAYGANAELNRFYRLIAECDNRQKAS